MRLTESLEKIKSLSTFLTRKDVYLALIIIFVGIASFCLGAMWQKDASSPDITIQNAASADLAERGEGSTTDAYVGSYTSKIYRLKTCPGVSAISVDNRVYFATAEDAETAGYIAAKNCKM